MCTAFNVAAGAEGIFMRKFEGGGGVEALFAYMNDITLGFMEVTASTVSEPPHPPFGLT